MRIGLGVAWLVVVAAEMIALHSGLGYLIIDSRNAGNRYDLGDRRMIVIGLIGLMPTEQCACSKGSSWSGGAMPAKIVVEDLSNPMLQKGSAAGRRQHQF